MIERIQEYFDGHPKDVIAADEAHGASEGMICEYGGQKVKVLAVRGRRIIVRPLLVHERAAWWLSTRAYRLLKLVGLKP